MFQFFYDFVYHQTRESWNVKKETAGVAIRQSWRQVDRDEVKCDIEAFLKTKQWHSFINHLTLEPCQLTNWIFYKKYESK